MKGHGRNKKSHAGVWGRPSALQKLCGLLEDSPLDAALPYGEKQGGFVDFVLPRVSSYTGCPPIGFSALEHVRRATSRG